MVSCGDVLFDPEELTELFSEARGETGVSVGYDLSWYSIMGKDVSGVEFYHFWGV